jgi:hypothetical protein
MALLFHRIRVINAINLMYRQIKFTFVTRKNEKYKVKIACEALTQQQKVNVLDSGL